MPLLRQQSTVYKGNGSLWWWRSELIIYLLAVLNIFDHFLNFSWKLGISSNPFSVGIIMSALFNFEVKMGEYFGKIFSSSLPRLGTEEEQGEKMTQESGKFLS